jgi:hypothetical protein
MRTWICLALLVALAALAGCGDSSGASEGSDEESGAVPEATETADEFAQRYVDAVTAATKGDCDPVDEFNEQSTWGIACPVEDKDTFADLEVVDAEEYGTGVLVDLTTKAYPKGYTIVAALNEDGRYYEIKDDVAELAGFEFPQVGSAPEDTETREETLADYVTAIREEDCDTWFEIAFTPTSDKEKECKFEFGPKAVAADELNADPDAQPELLGETDGFAFYGLEAGGAYRTLVTERIAGISDTKGAPPYVVHSYRAQND